MVVPRASPGRIIVVLLEGPKATIALSLFLLASKKKAVIVSFP